MGRTIDAQLHSAASRIRNGTLVTTPRIRDRTGSRHALKVADDSSNRGHVVVVEPSTEHVRQELLRHRANEHVRSLHERIDATPPHRQARVPSPSPPDASTGDTCFPRPPGADRIEVLERESQSIHHRWQLAHDRIRPMLLHSRPNRLRCAWRLFGKRRNLGGGRGVRQADQIVQNPFTPHHR